MTTKEETNEDMEENDAIAAKKRGATPRLLGQSDTTIDGTSIAEGAVNKVDTLVSQFEPHAPPSPNPERYSKRKKTRGDEISRG
jgi:hypothetical protein